MKNKTCSCKVCIFSGYCVLSLGEEAKQRPLQRSMAPLQAATDRFWSSAYLNGHHLLLSSLRRGGELGVLLHVVNEQI